MQPDPTADELIAQGASMRRLSRHFRSKKNALRYYAGATASRYSFDSDNCCLCNGPRAHAVAFTWRAFYHSRLAPGIVDGLLLLIGIFSIRTAASVLRFTTRHSLCRPAP